jgi:hypothetical protein
MVEERLNLNDRNVLEAVKKQLAEILNFNLSKEARFLLKKIELGFKEFLNLKFENETLYNEWQDIYIKLKWVAFPYLKSQEVIKLFEENLATAFNIERYPLENFLEALFLTIPLLEDRDIYKQKLREAMLKNNQEITSQELLIDGKLKRPTIGEWLNEYNKFVGLGKADKLKQVEFFNKNQNFQKLSPEEKEKIKRLIDLYERLKISSLEDEGTEEVTFAFKTEDRIDIYERGRLIESIKLEKPKIVSTESLPEEETLSSSIKEVSEVEEFKEIEKEVESLKSEIPTPPVESFTYNQIIQNTIEKLKLSFPDEILENRFKNIALSYLKDVRDEIETKEVLKRPIKIGGMELDEVKVEEIIKILKEYKPKIKPEIEVSFKKPALAEGLTKPEELVVKKEEIILKTEVPPSPPIPQIQEIKKFEEVSLPVEEEVKIEIPKEEKVEELPIKEEDKEHVIKPEEIITESEREIVREEIPEEKQKEETIVFYRSSKEESKPTTEEIKVKPRIYTPIDELRFMTLEDWRRYPSSKDAMNRVIEKIDLLAEESILKKAEGISAWKESEVNKLYLEIGIEAMEKGKPVEEVIKERLKENKPTLTIEEFLTIAELNQKLRF